MVAVRYVSLLLVLALGGCAWVQPPTESESLTPPFDVAGNGSKESLGQLMLTDEGLWAFVREGDHEGPRFERGALVAFSPREAGQSSTHLFGVILVRSWGVLMQRLDDRGLPSSSMRGDLHPAGEFWAKRHRAACFGSGLGFAEKACLADHPARGWRLFGLSKDDKLRVPPPDKWARAVPIRLDGLVQGARHALSPGARDRLEGGRWVAVPARTDRAATPHARIAAERDCALSADDLGGLQAVQVIEAPVLTAEQPIKVEAAAIQMGADVMVRCEGGAVTIAVPTLTRPLLGVTGTSLLATPYGFFEPFRLTGPSARQIRHAVLLGSALATGSTLAADYYLDQALRDITAEAPARRLAVDFMQVPAAAGRPEAALRAGMSATSGGWHRGNRPAFVLGKAWVYAALASPKEQNEATERLAELGSRGRHKRLARWLAWTQLRGGLARDDHQAVAAATSHFDKEGSSLWSGAAELLVNPALAAKQGPTRPAGAHPMRAALAEAPDTDSCSGPDSCLLDIYGRNFAALVALADENGQAP